MATANPPKATPSSQTGIPSNNPKPPTVSAKFVDDLVLIEKVTEDCLVETLKKRYEGEKIYVQHLVLLNFIDVYWTGVDFDESVQTTWNLFFKTYSRLSRTLSL
jgi:hypothetical protein